MTGLEHLSVIGFFVWWSIREVKLSEKELQAAITAAGIDYTLPERKFRTIFLDAVRYVQGQHSRKGLLIRKISKEKEKYVFGLVDESIDKKTQVLDYSHSATMVFNPLTGDLTSDYPHRAFDLVKAQYEEYKDVYTSDHIRDILLDVLYQQQVVNVRSHGGIYFLPAKYQTLADSLEQFVESLGDSEFSMAPQIDSEKSKLAIHRALMSSLRDQMDKYQGELDDESVNRPTALKRRIEEFKQIRDTIAFYSEAMAFEAGDLSDRLAALQAAVTDKLSAI